MPWCEPCERFYNPNSVDDGACPSCGEPLEAGSVVTTTEKSAAKVPWHFWLLLGALMLYLGWRAVQGVSWFFG
ncbi:MAG: hypothetical protein ACR2QE_01300 [Acidimicrobiales bacterium]